MAFSSTFLMISAFFHLYLQRFSNLISMANHHTASSNYRQTLRQRILAAAMMAFRLKGVKAVRMDDIASQLSISKRTLYEIYSNKELLLYECVRDHDETMERLLAEQITAESSVMDILICFMRLHIEDSSKTNPQFYVELVKYPRVKQYIEERRQKQSSRATGFMLRGVEEGFFRKDINYQIFNIMIDAFMMQVVERELYKTIPLSEIIQNVIIVILRGFCTDKGLAYINQLEL